jgi:hypothetical protein
MKLTRLSLACALTSALAACGGGGGSTPSSTNPNTGAAVGGANITLTGVASKGTIKDGIVNVYAIDAAGVRSAAPILSTRSSRADGSYNLNLGARTGLFLIEVSADAGTTMDDEYSNTIAMPPGLTLRSVVQVDANSSSTVTGHVTPFTDMLVGAALSAGANGALTSDNVEAAQAEVTKILGFNPLVTRPLNANSEAAANTENAAEKLQAVALAAISGIAHNNSLGCSGSASDKIKCAVNATTGSAKMVNGTVTIPETVKDALLGELAATADADVNQTTIKTTDGQQLFADAAVAPRQAAGAPSKASASPVADAKAFFSSLRTNLQAWSNSADNGRLRNTLDTMQSDFDNAVAPLDQSLADWVVMSGRGIGLFNNFAQKKTSDTSVGNLNSDSALGVCRLYKDSAATTEMLAADSGKRAGSVACVLHKKTVAGSERSTAASGLYNRDQITRGIILVPTGANSFSYTSRTLRETQSYLKNGQGVGYNFVTLAGNTQIGSTASGTVAYTLAGTDVTSATINGFMPARVEDNGAALTDREAWSISYAAKAEAGGVTKYTFSGKVEAQKNGASLGTVSVNDGTYVRAILNGDEQRVTEGSLLIGVKAGTTSVTGTLALSKFSTDRLGNRYLPTVAKFSGNFTNTRGDSFNGTISAQATNYNKIDSVAPQSASNYATGSAAFNGKLTVVGLKPLVVTFSARATGYKKSEFNGTYSDSTNQINFSGNNSLPLKVYLSSSSGVSLTWMDGENYLDVFKNNSKVGLINVGTRIINYTDGSFETLK